MKTGNAPRRREFLVAVSFAAMLAACSEVPQDTRKPFAGAEETKPASASLAVRARVQDEYPRMGGAAP